MKPTVGRIVHYHPHVTDQPLAAIIVAVNEDNAVSLCVFKDDIGSNICEFRRAAFSEAPDTGCWSWPPRSE